MAGRFKLITDEHWSKAHVRAAREAGWQVVRVVDVLGQATKDPGIMAYCERHGYVWVTGDKRAQPEITQWINSGRMLPGVIIGVERRKHRARPFPTLPSGARGGGSALRRCHPFRDPGGEVASARP